MAVIQVTEKNFEKEVLSAKETILMDFWAPWCGPCRMVSPIIDEIAKEVPESVKVCKVNVDEEPELVAQFGIMSIPTLVVVKNGEVLSAAVGVRPKQAILKMIG